MIVNESGIPDLMLIITNVTKRIKNYKSGNKPLNIKAIKATLNKVDAIDEG